VPQQALIKVMVSLYLTVRALSVYLVFFILKH